jgi:hypothetical protein
MSQKLTLLLLLIAIRRGTQDFQFLFFYMQKLHVLDIIKKLPSVLASKFRAMQQGDYKS